MRDIEARIKVLEDAAESDALIFVPNGVKYTLYSPQSVLTGLVGHKHLLAGISDYTNPLLRNLTAGETLAASVPVALVPARATYISYDETHTNSQEPLGKSAGNELLAQTFPLVAGYFWGAGLYLRKHGNPTDNLILYLYDASNVLIATSDAKAGSGLTTSFAWYDFWFADIPPTTAQTYKIVLDRSGANDANNYYEWAEDKTIVNPPHNAGYADGQMLAGATLGGLSVFGTDPYADAIFKIYTASGATSVLRKTKATSKILVDGFVGMTEEAIADAATGNVIRLGLVSGLSVTNGEIYYLSDTVGALGTAVGTYGLAVLHATSATTGELIVTQPPIVYIPKFLSTNTQLTKISQTGQADIYSVVIPGGIMGANGILRVTAYVSVCEAGRPIRYYFGTTSLDLTAKTGKITHIIANRNNASVQIMSLDYDGTTGIQYTTATEDTSSDVTYRMQVDGSGGDFKIEYVLLEIIK